MPAFDCRPARLDAANEQSFTRGQADRCPELCGDRRRCQGDTEPRAARPTSRPRDRRSSIATRHRSGGRRRSRGRCDGCSTRRPAHRHWRPAHPTHPRTSGAVCSTPPCTCRPRGPWNARSTDDTMPNETRVRCPPRLTSKDHVAGVGNRSAHVCRRDAPVSTSSTTRSPSSSAPGTEPCTARPSANVTSVVRSRRLWNWSTPCRRRSP